MRQTRIHLYLLFLFALVATACGGSSDQQEPVIDLNEMFPSNFSIVNNTVWRFDVNLDGLKEWLVLYQDLSVTNFEGSPTIAAVYRPVSDQDARTAPSIVPALLWLPSQGYICFGTCEPGLWDAITETPGPELVFLDKRGGATVGAAFFHWQNDLVKKSNESCMPPWDPFRAACVPDGFVPLGHFRADSVMVDPQIADRVVLTYKHNDRSDLAAQEIYVPKGGRYYRQEARTVYDARADVRSPDEAEVIFASGPPEDPTQAKLPEKLVLSFYRNYTNAAEIQRYFTSQAWLRTGQDCANGICGCNFARNDVRRVMVKQIAYESDFTKTTQVVAQVICIHNNGQRDSLEDRVWTLTRQADETWRLVDVAEGGGELLCPRAGDGTKGCGG
jgi:hypothetical protein